METKLSTKKDQEQINLYRLCPSCGNFSHVNENHKFCALCGTELIEECKKCKTKIENPTAQFCVKCGDKILIK